MSSPSISVFSSVLRPIVLSMIFAIMYVIVAEYAIVAITLIICIVTCPGFPAMSPIPALLMYGTANIPVAIAPHIPENPWIPITSSASSYPSFDLRYDIA